jgi:hypothetical protein
MLSSWVVLLCLDRGVSLKVWQEKHAGYPAFPLSRNNALYAMKLAERASKHPYIGCGTLSSGVQLVCYWARSSRPGRASDWSDPRQHTRAALYFENLASKNNSLSYNDASCNHSKHCTCMRPCKEQYVSEGRRICSNLEQNGRSSITARCGSFLFRVQLCRLYHLKGCVWWNGHAW